MKIISYLLIFLLGVAFGYSLDRVITITLPTLEKIDTRTSLILPIISSPTIKKLPIIKTKANQVNPVLDEYHPIYLMKQANKLANQKKYLPAILLLENLFFQVNIPYDQQNIKQKILLLTSQYLSKNSQANQIENRIKLLEKILSFLPESAEFRLKLIDEYIIKSDFYQAQYQLSYLSNYPYLQQEIQAVQQRFTNSKRFVNGKIKIPIIEKNNAWIIQANILGKIAHLLLDTGANLTVIKQQFIQAKNIDKNPKNRLIIHTANGTSTLAKAHLEQLSIGAVIDKNFAVGVMEKQLNDNIDGLLGTDWLHRFWFEINQQQQVLILNKKDR